MGLNLKDAPQGSGDFALPEVGIHNAVFSKIFDLGVQDGFEGKPQHKICIYWEIDELIPDGDFAGKPFTLFNVYTFSKHPKSNLINHLNGARGRNFTEEELNDFDLDTVLGVGCTINVVHETKNGKTRAKIASISPKMKAVDTLPVRLPGDFMPKWIAEKLGVGNPAESSEEFTDDVPF